MLDTGSEAIWLTGGTTGIECQNCPNLSRFRADRSSTYERLIGQDKQTLEYYQGSVFSEKIKDSVLIRPAEV
jgi:hypothetical protein